MLSSGCEGAARPDVLTCVKECRCRRVQAGIPGIGIVWVVNLRPSRSTARPVRDSGLFMLKPAVKLTQELLARGKPLNSNPAYSI